VRKRFLPVTLVSLCAVLHAQDLLSVWRVEVHGEAIRGPAGNYTAELDNFQHQKVAATSLRSDDFFEFRNIPYGDYWLTIVDGQNRTLYTGMVSAHPGGWQETVNLDAPKQQRPPSGPVSVAELRHPPSRKAYEAFVSSERFVESGDFGEAAAELEKATRLSPDWPDAHTNLAAQYLRLGRYQEAIAEARRAIELGKPNGVDLGNIAYAEYRMNRRAEAIESARAGLVADPSSARLHYLLGTLLSLDRATLAEGIPHLEFAARTIPGALRNLEGARRALQTPPPEPRP
jgi:tetratricopeptide (TPR) repeat protein